MASETMAGFVALADGEFRGREDELLSRDFDELLSLYRSAAAPLRGGEQAIHQLLRKHLPVYDSR
jgi:hypothetical protein